MDAAPAEHHEIPEESENKKNQRKCKFPWTLYTLLENSDPNVVCWLPDGSGFVIRDRYAFTNKLLPIYFLHSKFSSFQRQLNIYSFRKVNISGVTDAVYISPNFHRDDEKGVRNMKPVRGSSSEKFELTYEQQKNVMDLCTNKKQCPTNQHEKVTTGRVCDINPVQNSSSEKFGLTYEQQKNVYSNEKQYPTNQHEMTTERVCDINPVQNSSSEKFGLTYEEQKNVMNLYTNEKQCPTNQHEITTERVCDINPVQNSSSVKFWSTYEQQNNATNIYTNKKQYPTNQHEITTERVCEIKPAQGSSSGKFELTHDHKRSAINSCFDNKQHPRKWDEKPNTYVCKRTNSVDREHTSANPSKIRSHFMYINTNNGNHQDDGPSTICIPRQNDVVFSKDYIKRNWPGNVRFLNLVNMFHNEFILAPSNEIRMDIAANVIESITNNNENGRFLLKAGEGYSTCFVQATYKQVLEITYNSIAIRPEANDVIFNNVKCLDGAYFQELVMEGMEVFTAGGKDVRIGIINDIQDAIQGRFLVQDDDTGVLRVLENYDEQVQFVYKEFATMPTANDVLFFHSRTDNKRFFTKNLKFEQVVEAKKKKFKEASFDERVDIINDIIRSIEIHGGRFLRRLKDDDECWDVMNKHAASHFVRKVLDG